MSLSNIKVNNEQIISIDDTPGNNGNLTKNQYFMMSSNQFDNLLPLYIDDVSNRQSLMFRGVKGVYYMNTDDIYSMSGTDWMYTIYKCGEMSLSIEFGETYISESYAAIVVYDVNYNIVLKVPGVGNKWETEHYFVSVDISSLTDGLYYVYSIAAKDS